MEREHGNEAVRSFPMITRRERVYFFEDLSQLATLRTESLRSYSQPQFALDQTALSRVKQTTHSSSGEKKNTLCKATRSLQGRAAQSRMSKSIGAMQSM